MAEPLKNFYGPEIPRKIANMIAKVYSAFPMNKFIEESLRGYDELELMDRGRRMAEVLTQSLPADYKSAVRILVSSMGPKLDSTEQFGMSPFLYMPYSFFIAQNGLKHWEESMKAQYELTQRFTAEFCIRPFLIHHQNKTLALLKEWTRDPSPHVRRLVSEGTRPRLPWAPRLPAFQKDPRPLLELLEQLKDDSALYVRRSVANNLNDIGKDNARVLFRTAQLWMKDASPDRARLIRHALRSAVKGGSAEAFRILGFGGSAACKIKQQRVYLCSHKGKKAAGIEFQLFNTSKKPGRFLIDFRIHYVKANGGSAPKVFKLREAHLKPGESAAFHKKISLENMTTRRHYPGRHTVEALVNGQVFHVGSFNMGAA